MSVVYQNVAFAVHKATDEARAILTALEKAGHPPTGQTGPSASLFLALASMETKLLAADSPPVPMGRFVLELERLVRECEGRLASVKPFIEEALRIARQG
jgi:hypothetical protein